MSCTTALSAVCMDTGAGGVVMGGGGGKLNSEAGFVPAGAGGGCKHAVCVSLGDTLKLRSLPVLCNKCSKCAVLDRTCLLA